MAKKMKKKVAPVPKMSKSGIERNRFFGMMILAVGIGALIVVVRYFFISLAVPTDVYLIEPSQLIPGNVTP